MIYCKFGSGLLFWGYPVYLRTSIGVISHTPVFKYM